MKCVYEGNDIRILKGRKWWNVIVSTIFWRDTRFVSLDVDLEKVKREAIAWTKTENERQRKILDKTKVE